MSRGTVTAESLERAIATSNREMDERIRDLVVRKVGIARLLERGHVERFNASELTPGARAALGFPPDWRPRAPGERPRRGGSPHDERIRQLHAVGKNDRQIADEIKLTPTSIGRSRRRMGLEANDNRGKKFVTQ